MIAAVALVGKSVIGEDVDISMWYAVEPVGMSFVLVPWTGAVAVDV